jgi:ABC-type uncharacterized transport system YnjBCD permease subunit
MNFNTRAQIAAILGILLLAAVTVAPWVAVSHWLKPQEAKWRSIITHKDDLVRQMLALDKEVSSYQNIPEKKEANITFQKNIAATTLDSLQGFVNSNPKYQVFNFKTIQVPDSKEVKFSLVASYNSLGQLLTDLWNTFQFMEINSMIMQPNPNKPDEEVITSVSIRLP